MLLDVTFTKVIEGLGNHADSVVSVLVVVYLILELVRNWRGNPQEKQLSATLKDLMKKLDKQVEANNEFTRKIFELNDKLVAHVLRE
jgi:RNA-splicing ligase RtcB